MTVQRVSCLICRTGLDIAEESNNKRKARVLSLIHKRLCSALKLDFPLEFRKWNFSREPFPFCLSCQKVILRLCRLMDQLESLEVEISRCVSTLSMLTINSKSNVTELLTKTALEGDVPKSRKGDRELLKKKHQYFRDFIIQRFNAKVRIEQIRNPNPLFIETDTASLHAKAQPVEAKKVGSEYPHVVIATDNNYDDVEDDNICFDSSPIPPEPGSPPGNDTSLDSDASPVERDHYREPPTSNSIRTFSGAAPSNSSTQKPFIPSDSVPIKAGCDNSEIPLNLMLTDHLPANDNVDNVESDLCAKDFTTAQDPQQDDNTPQEEIVEACELDIKIRPLPNQIGTGNSQKTRRLDSGYKNLTTEVKLTQTLKNAKIHRHAGVQYLVNTTKAICLKCNSAFEFRSGSRPAWDQAKDHIDDEHGPKNIVNPLGKGLYDLNGFGFKELDKGFECSTCKKTFPFPPCRPGKKRQKWLNIKNHIENVHMLKKSGSTVKPKVSSAKRCHAGVMVSIRGTKARCSKCDLEFETRDGESSWIQAKKHISEQHGIPGIQAPPKRNEYHVEVVDKDRKLYRTIGHEFQELENGYECSTCKKFSPFASTGGRTKRSKWTYMKKHIMLVHALKDCGRCDICKAEVKNLSAHMRYVHGGESGRKVCEVCGKEFKSMIHLAGHRKSHFEPKFPCDVCGKKFTAKAVLESHQRIHGGEKPYVCEHCGKTFRFDCVYKTHVASAHGERKFACDQCDWKFGVKFLLNRHVKQVHQGIKPPPPKKRKKGKEPREESEEETSESDSLPEAEVEEA